MLSIAPGTWFLSPMFVLGSSDPLSRQLSIRFQRSQFQGLRIRIVTQAQELLFSKQLGEDIREWEICMDCWPKGTYCLFLEDEEKTYKYQVLND